jgi:hypothetical protein
MNSIIVARIKKLLRLSTPMVSREFVARMEVALKASTSNGDWANPPEALQELHMCIWKLGHMLQRGHPESIKEQSADCAAILMKIHERFGRSGS